MSLIHQFKLTKNVYVFTICLSLAFFFWLLNVLGKTYTTVIQLPVKYENLPTNKVSMNLLPESFAVTAKVSGYSLLVNNAGEDEDTVVVDARNLRQIKRGTKLLSFYHVSPILKELTSTNYSSYKVIEVLIDTLFIDFDDKVTRSLKVKPNIGIVLAKQFVKKDKIDLLPKIIRVTGPKSLLDTLTVIQSDSVFFENVADNITTGLNFALAKDDRIKLSPKQAIATINVEQVTESSIDLPIKFLNLPAGVNLKTFPNKVKVTYLVSISDFERIDSDNFEMFVDYNDINQDIQKLRVKEGKTPNFITITRIEPGSLEYIIKKQ